MYATQPVLQVTIPNDALATIGAAPGAIPARGVKSKDFASLLTVAAKSTDKKAATAGAAAPTPIGLALPSLGNPPPPLPLAVGMTPQPGSPAATTSPSKGFSTDLGAAAPAVPATGNSAGVTATGDPAGATGPADRTALANQAALSRQQALIRAGAGAGVGTGTGAGAGVGTGAAVAPSQRASSVPADATVVQDPSNQPLAASLLAAANAGASNSQIAQLKQIATSKQLAADAAGASGALAKADGNQGSSATRSTGAAATGRAHAGGPVSSAPSNAADSTATTDTATRSAGATPSAPSAADADASSSALGASFSAQIQADTSDSTPGSSVPAKASGVAPTAALFATGAAASAVAAEATADAGAAVAPAQIGAFAALLGVADKRGRDSAIDTVDAAGAAGGSAAGGSTASDGAAAALQANASQSSPTVSATMTDGLAKIDAGINSPEFSQALADRVSWMAGNNLNGATLQVNPPQLGPIELRVSVENGHAQVWLSAHSPATLDALQSSTPKLREMLSSQGFAQVSVDVSQRSFQDRSPYPQYSEWTPSSEDDAAAATSAVGAAASPRAALGVVDAYA